MAALITTKLLIPPLRSKLVSRPQLTAHLSEGSQAKIFLLSAPAGYGKTTLISQWITANKLPTAWITLDESDNDQARFFSYLGAAVQSVYPELCQEFLYLIKGPHLPPPDTLIGSLINDLTALSPQPAPSTDDTPPNKMLILVLDDYHCIQSQHIHKALQYLLDYQPPGLLLILLTREDPPLKLSKLRARGEMVELRSSDLRFDEGEIAQLFRLAVDIELKSGWVHSLAHITEGWVACLQLAAHSLQGKADIAQFLADFGGSNRYVIDYLMDEIMRHQSPETWHFFLHTSILNRLTPELCQAVSGREDSQEVLEGLVESNLLLIPLDEKREWYRYHHLFSDFARAELHKTEPERERELHHNACQWLSSHGYKQEAIQHALAGADFLTASNLILDAAEGMITAGEISTLVNWIESLPDDYFEADPNLMSLYIWAIYFTGQTRLAERLLNDFDMDQTGELLPLNQGWLLGLKAWVANNREDPKAVDLAQQALEVIVPEDLFNRAITHLLIGHNHYRRGNLTSAADAYREASRLGWQDQAHLALVTSIDSLALTMNDLGQRRDAQGLCQETAHKLVDPHGSPLPIADLLSISQSVLAYEANQLDLAIALAHKGQWASQRFLSQRVMAAEAERVLVQSYRALGDFQSAAAVIEEARLLGSGISWVSTNLDALQAGLFLQQGQIEAVRDWAQQVQLTPDATQDLYCQACYLTYARLLLAQSHFDQARAYLDPIIRAAESHGHRAALISIRILQARCLLGLKQKQQASQQLLQAIRLAAPQGYLRRFLDELEGILPTLVALQTHPSLQRFPFIRPFLERVIGQAQGGKAISAVSPAEQAPSSLLEPMTSQELAVLRLLSSGLSNQEIADRLVIGLSTAKWHLHNIYGKLGVKSRTSAIARAQQLHLI